MKKLIILLVFSLIYTSNFSQITLVSGHPENGSIDPTETVQIDDDLTFLFFYLYDSSNSIGRYPFSIKNGDLEQVPLNLGERANARYIGNLNNRYYFVNWSAEDGLLHEYNRDTNETNTISLPEEEYNSIQTVATMNDKLYFIGNPPYSHDNDIISYDGNAFEVIAKPAPTEYVYWRNYYSPSQNLLYLQYLNTAQNNYRIYTYNGINFNEIPIPENMVFSRFLDEFNSKVMIALSDGSPFGGQLYECDGNNLTHISPGGDKVLDFISSENKVDKRYYSFVDTATGNDTYFYEYDGSSLSLVASHPEYNYIRFLTEFDGKDYYSLFRNDISKFMLYSYDGTNLTLIEGEQGDRGVISGGILDNKLYPIYTKDDEHSILTSYSPGATEVIPVPNTPDYSIFKHAVSFQDMLISHYIISTLPPYGEMTLYTMTSSNQFLELQVTEHQDPRYSFIQDDKLYLIFFNLQDMEDKLFVWDGILDVPNIEDPITEVLVFPNPVKEELSVQLTSSLNLGEITLNIYSLDGKRLDTHLFKNNSQEINFPVSHLEKGIYILEVQKNSGNIFKKFIKS